MQLGTAEGSANRKDKGPCERFVTQYANVISDYSCQDPGTRGLDPLLKSRRQANVKHGYKIKFLKMKNLIGSLAEDFPCFETSVLSNRKMS